MAAVQLLFVATFFVCRILIGPWLTYYTLMSPSTTGLVKVGQLTPPTELPHCPTVALRQLM